MNKAREFDPSVLVELKALLGDRVPMIPFGVGTSLEGHILAINGGVSIDLSQMSKVLAVHQEDLDAVVQAGVKRKQPNEDIKHTRPFFPVDPGAHATLRGMAANRPPGANPRPHCPLRAQRPAPKGGPPRR